MDPWFCVDKKAARQQKILPLTDAQVNGPELCFMIAPTKFKVSNPRILEKYASYRNRLLTSPC